MMRECTIGWLSFLTERGSVHVSAMLLGTLLVLSASCAPISPAAAQASPSTSQSLVSSVVELQVLSDAPDLVSPWQTEGVEIGGGSGAIIQGGRILTNAHVVENAVAIEAKRADGSERFAAEVLFISHDADLALLEVADPRFFEGTTPIPIGSMPQLLQDVTVYGFPIGGATLSITSGIVSRIELSMYSQSSRELLSVQIDAAINPGNSGGPVIHEGELVGVAMEMIDRAQSVGYMVPAPVVQHFLDDVADDRYDGFPMLGAQLQDMESEPQRLAAGMKPTETGALVNSVDFGGPAYGVLQERDVLLSIDERTIANDLSVAWPGIGRIGYALVFQEKQIGESVSVTFLRQGKRYRATIPLKSHTLLVPGRRPTERPRYFVFGGLVLQTLTEELMSAGEGVYADAEMFASLQNTKTRDRREIILLQQVLPHPVNRGYQDWGGETIRRVNGVEPRDLAHLVELIDGTKGRWLRMVTGDGFLITLDVAASRAAANEILDDYGVPQDRYLGPGQSPEPRRRRRR